MSDTTQEPNQLPLNRRAFDALLTEIHGVDENDFVGITLDVNSAVYTVLGALPELQALRAQFVHDLPSFDITVFDKLETYARALGRANTEYKTALEPPTTVPELVEAAIDMRTILLADVNALIARGLLPAAVIAGLQGVNGHKNIVADLFVLADILNRNQASIASRTSVKPEEIYEAENLADRLGVAVGLREQASHVLADAIRNRQAAFTLFINAYEEVRMAVQYLRRKQGDAESIAPSLYSGRGPSKKKPADPEAAPEAPHASDAAHPSTGGASTPAAATAAVPAASVVKAASSAAVDDHGPFVR